MKNEKAIVLSIIAIITLFALIIGATYAYFQASGGSGTSANLRVTTYTTDIITFEIGADINIYTDATLFSQGKGNADGTTFARATLTANNKTNTATENYSIYLNIADNTFAYSVDTNTPELILTIKDGSNNEITSISRLTYKTVTDGKGATIKGFDITNKNGLLTLLNKDITTTSTTVEEWNVTVTFVNYNKDQSANAGKKFDAQLIITKDDLSNYTPNTINTLSATKSGSNLTVNLNVDEGTNKIDKYYYAIEETNRIAMIDNTSKIQRLSNILAANNLSYVESTSNTYTFTNIKTDSNYTVYAYAVDKNKVKTNTYNYKYTSNYSLPVINKVETSKTTNSITATVTASKGTNNISKYYYSIDNGNTFIESTSNSYTFSSLSSNVNYRIIVKVMDTNGKYSNTYVLNEKIELFQSQTLAEYVISQYNGVQGNNNIYHHDGTLENGIDDGSYRYAGSSDTTNNYVCFGSDETTCPDDSLYRIIGVFDGNVKLIKASMARSNLLGTNGTYYSDTDYKWSSLTTCPSETAYIQNNNLLMLANTPDAGGCSMWKHSELNTINLNTNFINSIGTTWSNMIIATTWKVSGYSVANATAKTIYNEEITNATKTYGSNDGISKIGLMYVSDYGFAASPEAWTLTMKSYDNATATENNWMYSGFTEWCISPKNNYAVVQLNALGDIINSGVNTVTISKIYPVFYLKPEILYISGSATKDSPIRII